MKDLFNNSFRENYDKIALQTDKRIMTYGELLTETKELVKFFLSLGITRDSHVAILLNNNEKYVECFLSLWEINATIVPVDSQLNYVNLLSLIADTDMQFIILQNDTIRNQAYTQKIIDALQFVNIHIFQDICILQINIHNGSKWRTANNLFQPCGYIMMYTSGSSGKYKGVFLSKDTIIRNVKKVIKYTEITSEDSILITLPLSYCYAISQLFTHLLSGAKVVLTNSKMNTDVLNLLNMFKITNYSATPYFYESLVKNCSKFEIHNKFRFFMSAGGYLSPYVIEKMIMMFPQVAFFNNYGQTEASPRLCYNKITSIHDDLESVGKPLPGVNIKIMDESNPSRELGPEMCGEIWYMSEDIMIGYYNQEPIDPHAYFASGDLGYINKNGNLVIAGRKDSLIKVNGRKVYKNAIENILNQLDCIQNIKLKKESSKELGEFFIAHVVAQPGYEPEYIKYRISHECKKNFNKWVIPKGYIFCDKIELSSNQKEVIK